MARVIVVSCLWVVFQAASFAQDCGAPPFPNTNDLNEVIRACQSYGGTWHGDIRGGCRDFPSDWCHKKTSANTPTGIDPVELVNQLPAPRNMKEMGQELSLAIGVAGMNAFIQGMKDNAARAAAAQAERERQAELARQQALIKRRQIVRNLLNTIGGNNELQLVFDDSALGIKRSQQKPAAKGYGINGLPGIYTGGSQDGNQGQDSGSYGIKGLPGVYLQNGTSTTSAQVQNNHAPAAQPQGYGIAALPAPAEMNAQNVAPPAKAGSNEAAPSAAPAAQTAPANEAVAQNAPPSQNGNAVPQDAAPPQSATKIVAKDTPAMQQLQAVAANSESAAQASSAEEAATKAGTGFDRAGAVAPPVRLTAGAPDSPPDAAASRPLASPPSDPCVGTADGSVNLRCARSNVVDPQRVRMAAALVAAADHAPRADRNSIVDQALDTANGDASLSPAPGSRLPDITPEGLEAFQRANADYRHAVDLRVHLQEVFNEAQQRREQATQLLGAWYRQVAEIDKAHLASLSGDKANQFLAELYRSVRQEDEAMHVAAERVDFSMVLEDIAKRDAEYALKAAGGNQNVSLTENKDMALLFTLAEPAKGDTDLAFLSQDIFERAYISDGKEQPDADLIAIPENANDIKYAQIDPYWKQHPNNVQRFIDDPAFRDSARAYWKSALLENDRKTHEIAGGYDRRIAEQVRAAGTPHSTAEQKQLAETLAGLTKQKHQALAEQNENTVRDLTLWIQQYEKRSPTR